MIPVWIWPLIAVVAYLFGSFSTGLTVAQLRHKPDLRTVGSKNTGTTNALRTMGLCDGLLTFLGDFTKAMLACLGGYLVAGQEGAMVAGLFAILGHNWPVFYGFRGGKGIASSAAVMLFCFPIPALCCIGLFLIVTALTRYISLASMLMLTAFAIWITVTSLSRPLSIAWAVLLAGLAIYRHRANIGRLLRGEENKLGQKAK